MAGNLSFGLRLGWICCLPFLPLLAIQARGLRKRIPKLIEAAGPRESAASEDSNALNVVILGESTAVGIGARTLLQALPGCLDKELHSRLGVAVRWRLFGRDGATIRQILLSEVPRISSPLDVAVVVLGVNDVFRLTSAGKWTEGIEQLSRGLSELGCRQIVFSTVPPVENFPALPWLLARILGLRAKILNHGLRIVACRNQLIRIVEVHFGRESWLMAKDGVHPSEQGYSEWARQLANVVECSK